ncbi:MAG: SDR family NAD(P)-dependent oxidoreductase [Oscillospiraceae bacterium]|nr:SDR family NAD(P)-dependent oxidoreductase [Oscillospiraceae bacterium]
MTERRINPYGKNVFLTGGSSGIGLACANLLAQNGYKVFAASRTPQTESAYMPGGGEIHPVKMDVCDQKSIESAAEIILHNDVGIIIHSAGIGIACPAEDMPIEAVARLMDTNFFAVLHLNSLVVPRFRTRGSGLCIMISSVASLFPIPYQSHYCSSKSALEAYAASLRMELSDTNTKVCLVLPGDTNTGFTGARSFEVKKGSLNYDKCIRAVEKMEKDEIKGRPPISAAQVVLKLCTKRNPPLRTIVGFDYKLLAFLRRFLPQRLVEFILKKMYLG